MRIAPTFHYIWKPIVLFASRRYYKGWQKRGAFTNEQPVEVDDDRLTVRITGKTGRRSF